MEPPGAACHIVGTTNGVTGEPILFLDDFDVLTDTPILTFPHRGGKDLSSPRLWGELEGVNCIYHFLLGPVQVSPPRVREDTRAVRSEEVDEPLWSHFLRRAWRPGRYPLSAAAVAALARRSFSLKWGMTYLPNSRREVSTSWWVAGPAWNMGMIWSAPMRS